PGKTVRNRVVASGARQCESEMRVEEGHVALACMGLRVFGECAPEVISATARHFDPPRQCDRVYQLSAEVRRKSPDMVLQHLPRRLERQCLEIGDAEMPGIVTMDDAPAAHPERQEVFEPTDALLGAAAAQIDMGEAVMRPGRVDIDVECLLCDPFGCVGLATQLVSKGEGSEKIRIARVRLPQAPPIAK